MRTDPDLARELREALRPLTRRLLRARTISLGKSGILARLVAQGRATAAELAVAEQISAQGVTTALRDLEEHGFVERIPDDIDRRRIWVQVTDAGRHRLEEDREAGEEWLTEAVATRLDGTERQVLLAAVPVLRKLTSEAADA